MRVERATIDFAGKCKAPGGCSYADFKAYKDETTRHHRAAARVLEKHRSSRALRILFNTVWVLTVFAPAINLCWTGRLLWQTNGGVFCHTSKGRAQSMYRHFRRKAPHVGGHGIFSKSLREKNIYRSQHAAWEPPGSARTTVSV